MAVVKVKTPTGKVQKLKISDIRPYSYYDYATIAKNQQSQTHELFRQTGGASIVLRNVQVPSSIPNGWEFELQEIRVAPVGTVTAADLDKVLKNTILQYRKGGSDTIFTKPLYEFATGSGVWTPKSDVDVPTIGAPAAIAVKPLPFSIFIEGGDVMNFILVTDFQFSPDDDGNYLSNDITLQVDLVGVLKKPAI